MRVLVGCEFSGVVRDAFAALGHDAWSCDLLPTEVPGQHIEGDVLDILDDGWDLAVFHPDCTYLCSSGLHWNNKRPERAEKTERAIEFVQRLMDAPIDKIAIENPIGILSTRVRKPDQIIQPYDFGEDASKQTCLWLKNLPILLPHPVRVAGRLVPSPSGALVERWANQTNTGQNRLGPSPDRWRERARTYQGIADAMASQWGPV